MDKDISQCSGYHFLQTDWFLEEALLENQPYLDGSLENHPGQEKEFLFLFHLAGSRACGASGAPECYL